MDHITCSNITHVSQHSRGFRDGEIFFGHDRSVRPLDVDVSSFAQLIRLIVGFVCDETWILEYAANDKTFIAAKRRLLLNLAVCFIIANKFSYKNNVQDCSRLHAELRSCSF